MKKYFNYMDEWLQTEKSYIWLLIIALAVLIGMFIDSLTNNRWVQIFSTGSVLIILSSIRAYTKK